MTLIQAEKNGKQGCTDENGAEIFPFIYDFIRFNGAFVHLRIDKKWGLSYTTGGEILPVVYDDIRDIENGVIVLADQGKWGVIDLHKNVIIPFKYDTAAFYGDDLVYVKSGGKFALFNRTGEAVSPLCYEAIWSFWGDFAKIKKDEKWGYIDNTGSEVVPCLYDDVDHEFLEGLARVNQNGKWGYINTEGKVIIPCVYDRVLGFYDNWARVNQNGKWGYINTEGKAVIPCLYDAILYDFTEELLGAQKGDKWGFIDKQGAEIIPFIYVRAEVFKNGLASVSTGGVVKNGKLIDGKYGCISTDGSEIIPVKFKGSDAYEIHIFYRLNKGFALSKIPAFLQSPSTRKQTTGKQLVETVNHLLQTAKTAYLKIDIDEILPITKVFSQSSKTSERKVATTFIHALCMHIKNNKLPKIGIDAETQKAFQAAVKKESLYLDDFFYCAI